MTESTPVPATSDDEDWPATDAGELIRPEEGHIPEADEELDRSRDDVADANRFADTAIDHLEDEPPVS